MKRRQITIQNKNRRLQSFPNLTFITSHSRRAGLGSVNKVYGPNPVSATITYHNEYRGVIYQINYNKEFLTIEKCYR